MKICAETARRIYPLRWRFQACIYGRRKNLTSIQLKLGFTRKEEF